MQFLANWMHVAGEDWDDRVAGWFAGTGLDAWVDPARGRRPDGVRRACGWPTRREPPTRPGRRPGWTGSTRSKVEAVGFGLVTLRRAGHDDPVVRVEDLRQQVEPAVRRPGRGLVRPAGLAAGARRRRRCSPPATGPPTGLQLRQEATLGDGRAGRSTGRCSRMPHGLRWTEEVDPLVLALVGGCDGAVPLRDQLAAAGGGARGAGGRTWPRWPCRSWRTWSSAGIAPDAGGAEPDAGGGADGQPGQRDGRRRGGRRDRRRAAGAGRGDPRRHPGDGRQRWPARCTSCASSTTSGRPPTSARRCWWSASSPSTATPARAAARPGTRPPRPRWPSRWSLAFVEALRARGATVETGRFRAHMLVESVNVGPRTPARSSSA